MVLLGNQVVETAYAQYILLQKKSDVPNSLNYVPSIEASNPDTITESNAAMVRFKYASHCSKLQEKQRRQSERDVLALHEATKQKELMLRCCLNAFNNDHAYATQPSTNADLLSLQCQSDSILYQPDGSSNEVS